MIVWVSGGAISGDGEADLLGQHYIVAIDGIPAYLGGTVSTPPRYRGLGVVGTWYEGMRSAPESLEFQYNKFNVGDGPATKIYWQLMPGITAQLSQGVELTDVIELQAINRRVAAQAIVHDVWTPLSWDAIDFNPYGMFNDSDPTKWTVYYTGTYLLSCLAGWGDLPACVLGVRFSKNAVAIYSGVFLHNTALTGAPSGTPFTIPARLNNGDVITCEVYQGTTVNQNITNAGGAIVRISP